MEFLVVGCGSIGQRHISNILRLGWKVSGYELDNARRRSIARRYGIEVFSDFRQALKKRYDGAFVCTPTSTHITLSLKLAQAGIGLFIEKPLSNSTEGIDRLIKIAKQKRVAVFVACNMVFLPMLKQVMGLIEEGRIGNILSARIECGFYLPYWHPYEDYRKGYSANRHLGGGVVIDYIHEIDIARRLFGKISEVFCIADKVSNLMINTEDIAEITLRFKSGVIAQIHMDYLQRTYRRQFEFIGETGVIIYDYIKRTIELYSTKTNQYEVFQESINTDLNIMFIEEIKHFANCIKKSEKPINDILFAKQSLEIALACLESSKKRKVILV